MTRNDGELAGIIPSADIKLLQKTSDTGKSQDTAAGRIRNTIDRAERQTQANLVSITETLNKESLSETQSLDQNTGGGSFQVNGLGTREGQQRVLDVDIRVVSNNNTTRTLNDSGLRVNLVVEANGTSISDGKSNRSKGNNTTRSVVLPEGK